MPAFPRFVAFGLLSLALTGPARAGIIGGSDLITNADLAKLEGWLGEGPLDITNIFDHTYRDGKDSSNFHAAADGKGRTFVVLRAITPTGSVIIGGYNPRSWNASLSSYVLTPDAADRTAFVFNLTNDLVQRQNADATGEYQTYNQSNYGPTFGGGHDIVVYTNLESGYEKNWSRSWRSRRDCSACR